MAHALADLADRLPIFPLPGVVLMPGELLPLHVFEPRYRALVAACMAGDRHLGIATLRPGHEAEYHRRPAVFPELGVGRIVRHHALPDGRSNILVSFVAAGRIEDEQQGPEPFRRVAFTALPLPSAPPTSDLLGLRVLAGQVLARLRPEATPQDLFGREGLDWLDTTARAVLSDPADRRAYLTARHGADRARLVREALASLLEEASEPVEA